MPPLVLVFVVLVVEAALILGLMAVFAKSGGWSALAKAYGVPAPYQGERRKMNWVRVGWVGYNGCMVVGADMERLYLSVWPFFNFRHPPLSIPWSEVSASLRPTLIGNCVSLRFQAAPKVNVEITRGLSKWLKEKSRFEGLPEG